MSVVDQAETQNVLVDQEDALTVYLQSLLGGGKTVPSKSIQPSSMEAVNSPVASPSVNPHAEPVEKVEEKAITPDLLNNIPEWATTEIRCLSATVAGLNIFIPADRIFSILNATNRLKPSTRMPTWIYELDDEDDSEDDAIQVVNTQKLIFDGVKIRRIKPNTRTYVVLVDDGSWGLSCDAISDVVTLKNDEVTWRGVNAKRRWLAGTSGSYGAVILDLIKIEQALIQ